MSARLIVVAVVVLLFSAFVAVNWSLFLVPTTLSLGIASFDAPLGLVMLVALLVVTGVFLVYMAWWQAKVLLETRRHTLELQAQRKLADEAEASRFTALQAAMQAEMQRLASHVDAKTAELRQALTDSGNTLAAYIGEVEDRVEQALDPARPPRAG